MVDVPVPRHEIVVYVSQHSCHDHPHYGGGVDDDWHGDIGTKDFFAIVQ